MATSRFQCFLCFIFFSNIFADNSPLFDDSVITTMVHPKMGSTWSSSVFPVVDIDLKMGLSAEELRQAPFSFITCISSGESSDIYCNCILDGVLAEVKLDPLVEGISVIRGWIQPKHFYPDISRAIGVPSLTYVWNSPIDAVNGLNQQLEVAVGYKRAIIEAHISIAYAQLSNIWQSTLPTPFVSSLLHNLTSFGYSSTYSKNEFSVAKDEVPSSETIKDLLKRVAIVTISNAGYVELTLNCLASLRVKCNMPCVLQVVCVDETCSELLRASQECKNCPETIHTIPETQPSIPSELANYNTNGFNAIVRYKFFAMHDRLATHDFVLFTDGDVVFLRPEFLSHLVRVGANLDIVAQCDLMGPVLPNQICATMANITNEDGTVERRNVDYLCSGFILIRSTPTTLRELDPKVVNGDPNYIPEIHDQVYFNKIVKHKVKYATLSRSLFPNGSPFAFYNHTEYPPPANPYIIHYNYFPGPTKINALKERGHWFSDSSYLSQQDEATSTVDVSELSQSQKGVHIHVGGQERRTGWTVVDISNASEAVDVVASMDELNSFADGTVSTVYASHCLEHAAYKRSGDRRGEDDSSKLGESGGLGVFSGGEVARTLSEWRRVLRPGGLLFIAVPDLPTIAQLYLNGNVHDRAFIMRILYGGQENAYDFHSVGFDYGLLSMLLLEMGFCDVVRVDGAFGIFEDTSGMSVFGTPISLNLIATACDTDRVEEDGRAKARLKKKDIEVLYEMSQVQMPSSVAAHVN